MSKHAAKKVTPEIQAGNGELPEGWAACQMGDVANVVGGGTPKASDDTNFSRNGHAWITPADLSGFDGVYIEKGRRDLSDKGLRSSSAKLMPAGTVLMSSRAPIGYVAVAVNEICTNQGFKSFVCHEDIHPEYVYYWLKYMRPAIERMGSGSTFTEISGSRCKEVPFEFPPLAEQKRIVGQVEALLARVNVAGERLSKVPAILKLFRQSVLAASCSGQLTADWREEHPDTESAHELLVRIRKGVLDQLRKKREIDVYTAMFEEFPIEHSNEGLPETWLACRVGHIGFVCNGSTPSRKRPEFWGGEINWVSSGEVQNNLIHNTRERITEAGFSNSSVRLLPPGTVLIAMIGEGKTRGQTAILEIESTINQNMAAIDLRHGGVLSKYLWYWFKFRYLLTRQEGAGSGPPALNCQRVRELPFILPPFAEQQEIVRRIESLFALADRIEQRTKEATERVKKTTQSILARAFRGELVESEAQLARREGREFESAAQLLGRIQVERKKFAST